MAYTLGNKCPKNCCKWTILVQLIVKYVVTCFFGKKCIFIKDFFAYILLFTFSELSLVRLALDLVD